MGPNVQVPIEPRTSLDDRLWSPVQKSGLPRVQICPEEVRVEGRSMAGERETGQTDIDDYLALIVNYQI